MPVEADVIYRNKSQVVADFITRFQARVPDVHTEEDGNVRILAEVVGEVIEGIYLANQILRDNLFIQSANLVEIRRYGEQYGLPIKTGTFASGTLRFNGAGGTFIPAGAVVGADMGNGDVLYFVTTADATIPNPGDPGAPVAADAGAGSLAAALYEFAVTFVTAQGETELGLVSNALNLAVSHSIALSGIPLGGPGTIARNLYVRINGGAWAKLTNAIIVSALANNTLTSMTVGDVAASGTPPDVSTAERVTTTAQSEETGTAYNAAIGSILELIDLPDGVTDVTNTTTFTGGSDEEDMEDFRTRLLEFLRNPRTGSKGDLEVWAESIDGVETATAFPNDNLGVATNGHVTVRIAGPDGTIPSAAVIQAVIDDLAARDLAVITIHVTTFTQVATNVTVAITLQSGYALADVSASVQEAITNYINGVQVGGTVYVAGIVDAVFGLPGVATVSVSVPATDQTATATQKRIPGTITVS